MRGGRCVDVVLLSRTFADYIVQTERARSLSPDKPTTPQSFRSAADTPRSVQEKAADTPTPAMEPPTQQTAREDSLQRLTASPAQALEDIEPKKPAPNAAALGRSGTLSWQRRPQSGVGSIRRPMSVVSTTSTSDKNPAASPSEPSSPERPISRNQIAQSLGAKDPSWFKQTPDRGTGSAAYRRNQEDNPSDVGSLSGRKQLPGMSRESTAEPEVSSPPPESIRSSSPSRASSVRGSAAFSNRFSSNTSISGGDAEPAKVRSPLPVLDSQKFAPPSEQGSSPDGVDQVGSVRGLAMSPTQGRISPERTERPASPTKGMGGFVQSAMLKRSDSVNKRWSTQVPQGLSRQNSTLSNRGSATPSGYSTLSKSDSRPTSLSRDNSMEPSSRPGSSHSNLTITKDAAGKDTTSKAEFVKPALPHHSRSKSYASTFSQDDQPQDETSPPSPSKRWSPTKSSWLENALNKPNSPKPKQAPPPQPSWMTEINRIKQQRGSVDLGKGGPLQSPPDTTASGRSSPIKDIQLKPVVLRKTETPKKEEPAERVQPSPKPKPVVETPKKEEVEVKIRSKTLETPQKEDPAETAQPSLKPKPSPKPSIAVKGDDEPRETPQSEPTKEHKDINKDVPADTTSKAPLSTPRFAKSTSSPSPAIKPKPQTPPKTDFRAGLRSRQAASESSKKDEVNELQNVFGRLKKTETKNYVAPDTLKNNILRGKAGLALTGGPKPSVRRDEFKESIVSKKAAMLAKAQEEGSAALKKAESSNQPTETPEAIAKRKTLGRADSTSKPPPPREPETTPEALSRKESLRAHKPLVPEKQAQPTPSFPPKEPAKSSKLADRFNPALAGILARGPPPMSTSSTMAEAEVGEPMPRGVEDERKGPAPELTHMTKGRARGPKRRAPASKQAVAEKVTTAHKVAPVAAVPLVKAHDVLPSTEVPKADMATEEPAMMRTPARESLKAKPATPAKSPEISRKLEKSPSPELPRKPASLEIDRRIFAEVKHAPTPKKSASTEAESPKQSPLSPKPLSWKSSRPLPTPSTAETQKEPSLASRAVPAPKAEEAVDSPKISASSPKNPTWRSSRPLPSPTKAEPQKESPPAVQEIPAPNTDASPVKETQSPEKPSFSVKNATALWGRQSTSSSPAAVRTKSPIKLPTKADEQTALKDAGLSRPTETVEVEQPKPLAPKPKPVGLGLGSLGSLGGLVATRSRESSPPKPLSAKGFPISPPASAGRPQSEPFKATSAPDKSNDVFADFFDEPPVTADELPEHIDTTHILNSPPLDLGPSGKIRTLRKQIHELTGDGKLTPLPMQEEHVLFQDSMYLCTHVFGDAKGARTTEVYLWSGNGVAEATLEDAQLFGRNAAKQNQGKLIILRQGKETPNFFEALGGIVITRRGSRPSSKQYMLCGRRHLGHIAFDEVDFSPKSFCSGFAYIISTEGGKVFLWKGRGCSAEELSGARLMGMDLNLSGELTEIDEGSEPSELLSVFPLDSTASTLKGRQPVIPRSADHWRYKATSERYRSRLFKIEQQQGSSGWGQGLQVSSFFAPLLRRPSWQMTERPQTPVTPKSPSPQVTTKVVEIMPFSQRDLEPEYIYVLDAFFEMYM